MSSLCFASSENVSAVKLVTEINKTKISHKPGVKRWLFLGETYIVVSPVGVTKIPSIPSSRSSYSKSQPIWP